MPKGRKGFTKGQKFTQEHRANLSKARKGQPSWNKGKKLSKSHRQHLKEVHLKNPQKYWLGKKRPEAGLFLAKGRKHLIGQNHWNWQGGVTPINEKIRRSIEYKLWRKSVFERDKYTCVWCGVVGGNLEADHIKPFAHYPELRFAIDNGRTLCRSCHRKTDTYGNRRVASAQES